MKKFRKISKILCRILWRLMELVVACVIVAVSLTMYFLHESPMDGQFLMPEIEKYVLPNDSGYHIQSDTVMISSDWQKPGLIQINIKNLRILRPDETEEVSLPRALLAYDFWHLITLNYTPSMLLLRQPKVNLIMSDKGLSVQGSANEKPHSMDLDWGKRLVHHLMSFRRVDILDAQFSVQDLPHNRTFTFSEGQLKFHRGFHWMQDITFDTRIQSEGIDTRMMLSAELNRFTKNLSFQAGIPKINLGTLGYLLPILKGVDFPSQISLKGEFDVSGKLSFVPDIVKKINFNVQALEAGTLNLPEPLTNIYPVKKLNINGVITQGCSTIKIASSEATLSYGTHATLDVDVLGVADFLKSNDINKIEVTLKSTVTNVPTEKVKDVWPKGVGTDAHEWVAEHLTNGAAETADFTLYFKGDELTDLYGDILVKNMTVDYLPPMPKIDGVSGHVYLYPDKVHIVPESGYAGNLKLLLGEILLTDVDIDPSWANITLKLSGPVKEALQLLDSQPLELVKDFGIAPEKSSGTAEIETNLYFKLDTGIEPEEVKVSAKADVKKASISLQKPNLKISDADLKLNVQDNILDVDGTASLFEVPFHLKWTEYFFPKKNISSVYDISTNISTDDLLEAYPSIESWMKGKLALHLQATKNAQTDALSGQLLVDATDAYLRSYLFNSIKQEGMPLSADIRFDDVSSNGAKANVNVQGKLDQNSQDISVVANLLWSKELMFEIKKFLVGRNDFSLYFKQSAKEQNIKLKGSSIDLSAVFSMPEMNLNFASDDESIHTLLWDIHLDQLILNSQKHIKNLIVKANRQSEIWQSFHTQADLSSPFILVYDDNKNQFQGSYSDLGDLMDYLNLSDRFDGGKMSFVADQNENGELHGVIDIDRFQMKDPGFIMQAMTILGIVDAFLGNDIVFGKTQIPFLLQPNGNLKFKDAYMSGISLGITFEGEIQGSKINLSGSVVPAHGINSLPGRIPLIGFLFRKSEGGGLISVPYSIKGSLFAPETTFHPLGTITPGVLSNLF